jgi:hypothetical protein
VPKAALLLLLLLLLSLVLPMVLLACHADGVHGCAHHV